MVFKNDLNDYSLYVYLILCWYLFSIYLVFLYLFGIYSVLPSYYKKTKYIRTILYKY